MRFTGIGCYWTLWQDLEPDDIGSIHLSTNANARDCLPEAGWVATCMQCNQPERSRGMCFHIRPKTRH